ADGLSIGGTSTVDHNVSYSNGGNGIYIYGVQGSNAVVTNNLVYGNGAAGILSDGTIGEQILSNTTYQLTGAGIAMTAAATTNAVVRNNIVYVGSGIGLDYGTAAHSALSSDYNDVYVSGAGSFARIGGNTSATRDGFYSGSSLDQHTLTSDPK